MKHQINITEANEEGLVNIKRIGVINGVDVSNREKQVNLAIKIANDCSSSLDEESLIQLTGLKKSF